MSRGALVFMLASWGAVLALTAWAFVRLMRGKSGPGDG